MNHDNVYKFALIPLGNIKRLKLMSQDNTEAQTQKCKLLPDSVPDGCAVIAAEGSKLDVPLQKRKEDAKKTLYLNRV